MEKISAMVSTFLLIFLTSPSESHGQTISQLIEIRNLMRSDKPSSEKLNTLNKYGFQVDYVEGSILRLKSKYEENTNITLQSGSEKFVFICTLEGSHFNDLLNEFKSQEYNRTLLRPRNEGFTILVRTDKNLVIEFGLYGKTLPMFEFYDYKNGNSSNNSRVLTESKGKNKLEINSNTITTDITVKKGDRINLRAEGSIVLGMFVGSGSPDGISGLEGYSKVQRFRHGSLIGKIGNGEWFFVGSSASIVAQNAGTLSLQVNDNDPDNNEGSFIVEYSINNSPNGTLSNVSTVEDNKFAIRNTNNNKSNFQLSSDQSNWTLFSLDGSTQSNYWFPNQQQGFFRITTDGNKKTKVYKTEAGKKYKIEWNTTEQCWDLYTDIP